MEAAQDRGPTDGALIPSLERATSPRRAKEVSYVLPIDVTTVRDANDGHGDERVFNGIDYAVGLLADPVLVLAGELLRAVWPRIDREREDAAHDEAPDTGGKALDLLLGRPRDEDAIGGHDA